MNKETVEELKKLYDEYEIIENKIKVFNDEYEAKLDALDIKIHNVIKSWKYGIK